MGTSWQETSGSSNNILQGKHFAVGGTRSWEIPLKVLLSWSFLTAQQTLPVLCVLGAPHGVRASFLHSCSFSLPEDFRSLASASQDLFPLFLLLLCKHVPVETIFFSIILGQVQFFQFSVYKADSVMSSSCCWVWRHGCKAGGNFENANAEYFWGTYWKIWKASPSYHSEFREKYRAGWL